MSTDSVRVSIGSVPGDAIVIAIPEPSSTVSTAARPVISQRSLRRRARRGAAAASTSRLARRSLTLMTAITLGQLADQVEDRQVHRDDNAADEDAEEGDHHRL